jgi:hypothetical protein
MTFTGFVRYKHSPIIVFHQIRKPERISSSRDQIFPEVVRNVQQSVFNITPNQFNVPFHHQEGAFNLSIT